MGERSKGPPTREGEESNEQKYAYKEELGGVLQVFLTSSGEEAEDADVFLRKLTRRVCFPFLSMEEFDHERILMAMGNVIGKALKVDANTRLGEA